MKGARTLISMDTSILKNCPMVFKWPQFCFWHQRKHFRKAEFLLKGQQSPCFLLYPCRCSWAVTVSICLICNVPIHFFFSVTDYKIKSEKTRPRNLHVFGNSEVVQLSQVIPSDCWGWKLPWLPGGCWLLLLLRSSQKSELGCTGSTIQCLYSLLRLPQHEQGGS